MFKFIRNRWNQYWFSKGGVLNLGIARIVICFSVLISFYIYRMHDYTIYLSLQDSDLYNPCGILKFFGPSQPSALFFEIIKHIAHLSTWLAIIGLFSRVSLWFSCLSNLILASLLYSFSPTWSHGFNIPLLAQITILFAPC